MNHCAAPRHPRQHDMRWRAPFWDAQLEAARLDARSQKQVVAPTVTPARHSEKQLQLDFPKIAEGVPVIKKQPSLWATLVVHRLAAPRVMAMYYDDLLAKSRCVVATHGAVERLADSFEEKGGAFGQRWATILRIELAKSDKLYREVCARYWPEGTE